MCGKFTAMVSWAQIVEYASMFTREGGKGQSEGETGEIATYRVNGLLPVVVWDAVAGGRRVVPMRWGFPGPRDCRRPRLIHGRSESIDAKEPFRKAGRRQTGADTGTARIHARRNECGTALMSSRSASR